MDDIKNNRELLYNREFLCKILHYKIKHFEKSYLKHKRHLDNILPDWREPNTTNDGLVLQHTSRKFKETQKVLEYLRKGKSFVCNNIIDCDLGIVSYKISIYGKDTWRKNENTAFEIMLYPEDINGYKESIKRELKLKRIVHGKDRR